MLEPAHLGTREQRALLDGPSHALVEDDIVACLRNRRKERRCDLILGTKHYAVGGAKEGGDALFELHVRRNTPVEAARAACTDTEALRAAQCGV